MESVQDKAFHDAPATMTTAGSHDLRRSSPEESPNLPDFLTTLQPARHFHSNNTPRHNGLNNLLARRTNTIRSPPAKQKRHINPRTRPAPHPTSNRASHNPRPSAHRPQKSSPLARARKWPLSTRCRRPSHCTNPPLLRRHMALLAHAAHLLGTPQSTGFRKREQEESTESQIWRSRLRSRESVFQVGRCGD